MNNDEKYSGTKIILSSSINHTTVISKDKLLSLINDPKDFTLADKDGNVRARGILSLSAFEKLKGKDIIVHMNTHNIDYEQEAQGRKL